MMDKSRLQAILAGFERARVLVIGDYFLDKYLDIDRRLAETSLETGLEAHQVVRVRTSPGAAGTVVCNLRALQVGVVSLGVIGDDGEGYELLRGLRERGVDTTPLMQSGTLYTPTYTKPMMCEPDGRVHELSRLDIKNRAPLPRELEDGIIARLQELLPSVQGVIVADQVPERNYGVMTDRVRQALIDLAAQYPQVVIVADSRMRVGEYRGIYLKPNEHEAMRALHGDVRRDITDQEIEAAGRTLSSRTGRPVFVTVGERGVLVCTESSCRRVPAVPVTGEIDIVGAGDSTISGIVGALCCEATPEEAALVGNLVASVTIKCIGTTGTASQEQVVQALGRWQAAHG
ncbi:MAG: carbohydrate kinase [Chloroflexi bacterium]|jgi:rfaE bifunctional protein kinase chain/domain|nr:carbohydrate kinase [Chloroflexota bacterium]